MLIHLIRFTFDSEDRRDHSLQHATKISSFCVGDSQRRLSVQKILTETLGMKLEILFPNSLILKNCSELISLKYDTSHSHVEGEQFYF